MEAEFQFLSVWQKQQRSIEKQQLTESELRVATSRVLVAQQLAASAEVERKSYMDMRDMLLSPRAWMYTTSSLEEWRARVALGRKGATTELEVAKGLNRPATEESKAPPAATEPSH